MTIKKMPKASAKVAALLAKADQTKPRARGFAAMEPADREAVTALCMQYKSGKLHGWTCAFLYDFLAENVATFSDFVKFTTFKDYIKRLDVNG